MQRETSSHPLFYREIKRSDIKCGHLIICDYSNGKRYVISKPSFSVGTILIDLNGLLNRDTRMITSEGVFRTTIIAISPYPFKLKKKDSPAQS